MKKYGKRFVIIGSIALVVIVILGFVWQLFFANSNKSYQFNSNMPDALVKYKSKATVVDSENEISVSNDNLAIKYNKADLTINVEDKKSNKVWTSYFDESGLDKEPNELWKNNIKALMNISYIDSSKKSSDIIKSTNLKEKCKVSTEVIDNGFRLKFNYQIIAISVSVDVTIDNGKMYVSVPEDGIKETGKFKLISLSIMPYLGSAKDSDDGYFLYPNGPGEIFKFKSQENRLNSIKEYNIPLYDKFKVNLDYIHNTSEFDKQQIKALIPAYGVKVGQSGFVAIIEQGDADAEINVTPGGVGVSANRIGTTFIYRHDYKVGNEGLSVSGGVNKFPLAQMYDEELISGERRISYSFLSGEDANYSGMARETRKNLIEREVINDTIKKDKMPILVEFFMGVTQQQMIIDKYIKMTTYDQAQEMLNTLSDHNVDNMYVNLIGWSKSGYGQIGNNEPSSSQIGGKSGLSDLGEYCASIDSKLFVQANYIDIEKGKTKGASSSMMARDQNSFIFEDVNKKFMLMNPFQASLNANKTIKYLSKANVNGILYEDIGGRLYADSNKKSTSNRKTTMSVFNDMMFNTNKELGNAATSIGNIYSLKNAQLVKDVPNKSSNILFSDETVPFYQMVIHSSVIYTGDPINLFHDEQLQMLKMVEYGFSPSYQLTYEPSFELRDTEYNMLFTSKFDSWKDKVADCYSKLSKDFDGTWNAQMISHEIIDTNVVKVSYSNNTIIYVNYNSTAYEKDGIKIEPTDYTIVR